VIPIVCVVAAQLLAQGPVLVRDRLVEVVLEPEVKRLDGTSESGACDATKQRVAVAASGPTPEVGKPKEVERLRGDVLDEARLVAATRAPAVGWLSESHQARLRRMESQAVLAESRRQCGQDPPRVILTLERYDEVVGVAHQESPAAQPGLHHAFEPHVQDRGQVDVREQRGDHATLRRTALGLLELPCLEHSRLQPLVDRATQHAVVDPLVQKAPQMTVIQRVEETLDVHFQHPTTAQRRQPLPHGFQGLMGRSTRAEAEATRQEVLLVDHFEHHRRRLLEDLVLVSRGCQWAASVPRLSGCGLVARAARDTCPSSGGRPTRRDSHPTPGRRPSPSDRPRRPRRPCGPRPLPHATAQHRCDGPRS